MRHVFAGYYRELFSGKVRTRTFWDKLEKPLLGAKGQRGENMPNRIIKESICTSDTIDRLSWFDEVVFYRLIVNCDDYGRFDGRGAILKSRLFPLKGGMGERSVRDAVRRLQAAGLVICYKAEGRPYLQLTTWDKHQQVRAKKSKYPAYGGGAAEMEDEPMQKQSNQAGLPELFARFWAAYPKKGGESPGRGGLLQNCAGRGAVRAHASRDCPAKGEQRMEEGAGPVYPLSRHLAFPAQMGG